jgi:hypothetical protein
MSAKKRRISGLGLKSEPAFGKNLWKQGALAASLQVLERRGGKPASNAAAVSVLTKPKRPSASPESLFGTSFL